MPLRNEWDYASIIQLWRIMKREKTDVVHVHKGLAHTLAYIAARLAAVPVFVVNRGVTFPLTVFNRAKYRFRGVSRIVTVSQEVKEVLIQSGRIPPEEIVVIYGGVDLSRFDWRLKSPSLLQDLGIKPGSTIIGMIGNLREWKGHRFFLQAVKEILPSYPDIVCLIIGSDGGRDGKAVKKCASDLGIEQQVIFTGFRKDIPELLSLMTFTVNAATAGEGLTGALRESLAMKKPAIATAVGGNREIILPGKTGFLVPPRNPAALAEAMLSLLADPKKGELMGEAGYRLVTEKLSYQMRIEKMEALYQELLQQRKQV